MEDKDPLRKWQNAVHVSSNAFEESLWNDCDEAAVDFVADGHGLPVMDLTGKSLACKKENRPDNLGDSNPHHKECKENKVDRAEHMKYSQAPPRRSE